MGLIAQAQADIKAITTDLDGFAVELTLEAPDNSTAAITGLHTKIGLAFDTEGRPINSQAVHISFSEDALPSTYSIRNSLGVVSMAGHNVTVADSTGNNKKYRITQWIPDETVGLVFCVCSNLA